MTKMFLVQLFVKMTQIKHLNNLLDLNLFIRDLRLQKHQYVIHSQVYEGQIFLIGTVHHKNS